MELTNKQQEGLNLAVGRYKLGEPYTCISGYAGSGKTTLVRWLAMDNDLYTDLGSGLKAKFGAAETVKKVRGKLLVEIGEMKVINVCEEVMEVFEITGFADILVIE